MNNCTCGVKFTGGLCSDWCDSLKPAAVGMPMHDVSGTTFISGVTNLTAENIYDAMEIAYIGKVCNTIVEMTLHPALLSRMRKCGLIDKGPLQAEWFQGIHVLEHPMLKQANVFDTLIQQGSLKIILRTREA